nr:MAG TPA: hypothetical protein [Caudoviricetes sp.]
MVVSFIFIPFLILNIQIGKLIFIGLPFLLQKISRLELI